MLDQVQEQESRLRTVRGSVPGTSGGGCGVGGGGETVSGTTSGARPASPSVFASSQDSSHSASHSLFKTQSCSSSGFSSGVKVKRTRQRVDAGEPRNSYASIANFSSTRSATRPAVGQQFMRSDFSFQHNFSSSTPFTDPRLQPLTHHQNQSHFLPENNSISKRARVENIVYNMMQVSGPSSTSVSPTTRSSTLNSLTSLLGSGLLSPASQSVDMTNGFSSGHNTRSKNLMPETQRQSVSDHSESRSPSPDAVEDEEMVEPETDVAPQVNDKSPVAGESDNKPHETQETVSESEVTAKPLTPDTDSEKDAKVESQPPQQPPPQPQVNGCKKRKLYQPQQTAVPATTVSPDDEEDDLMDQKDESVDLSMASDVLKSTTDCILSRMSRKNLIPDPKTRDSGVLNLSTAGGAKEAADEEEEMLRSSPAASVSDRSSIHASDDGVSDTEVPVVKRFRPQDSVQDMLSAVKAEVLENVVKAIEMTFEFARRQQVRSESKEKAESTGLLARMLESKGPTVRQHQSSLRTDDRSKDRHMDIKTRQTEYPVPMFKNPLFPQFAPQPLAYNGAKPVVSHMNNSHHQNNNHINQRQTDVVSPSNSLSDGGAETALSLVLTPRRKRSKVTDTRMTPRTVSRLLAPEQVMSLFQDPSPPATHRQSQSHSPSSSSAPPPLVPVSLPTSVAVPNPSLSHDSFSQSFPAFSPADSRFLFSHMRPSSDHHHRQSSVSPVHRNPLPQHPHQHRVDSAAAQHQLNVVRAEQRARREAEVLKEQALKEQQHQANSAAMAQAVSNALAAHHLSLLAANSNGHNNGLNNQATRDRSPTDSLYTSMMFTKSLDSEQMEDEDSSMDGGNNSSLLFSETTTSALTSTLTPMHLRKAKLMFFYVRYPSSAVLKMFFPDIRFNKNNTAQLVKWFSNFREFYYIQMEKYARQAVAEGVVRADDITVSNDAELIRVLNLHYNRNNHIEVREFIRLVKWLSNPHPLLNPGP